MGKYQYNYSVYLLRFPDNKIYIGQTCVKPELRWDRGQGYKKRPELYAAIQEAGWDNIDKFIISNGLSEQAAKAKEMQLIVEMDAENPEVGYNRTNFTEIYRTIARNNARKHQQATVYIAVPKDDDFTHYEIIYQK